MNHDSTEYMSIDETSCKILTNQNFSDIHWRDFRIYVFVSASSTAKTGKFSCNYRNITHTLRRLIQAHAANTIFKALFSQKYKRSEVVYLNLSSLFERIQISDGCRGVGFLNTCDIWDSLQNS